MRRRNESGTVTEGREASITQEWRQLQVSPFCLFGSRPSLLHLLHHSDITDFHLPDEDFGLLKLKKLQSISLLELFVTEPSKQKKY
ncbi:unnamed protein product [Ranitomeya imitator]|uniref:Maturase K n=1 Tax=Ranitomeya imitator TaxID=111125 RepID=A0ABN9LTW5_9NEOB|nr:unnamed protein product [Ranitomeya imitator]